MDLFSHVLWTSVLARNKLWHDEAILFALLPDLGFFLILMYVFFGTPMRVGFSEAMLTMPSVFPVIYHLLHSFVVLGIVALLVWKFQPKLLPALSAWALHICMDIPFHTGIFATRILYPLLPDFAINGFAWDDYRILGASYFLLLVAWYCLEMRELAKHRRRERWMPDWIDRLERSVGGLINPKPIPTAHAEVGDNRKTSLGIPGEDPHCVGQAEDNGAGTLPPPQAGA